MHTPVLHGPKVIRSGRHDRPQWGGSWVVRVQPGLASVVRVSMLAALWLSLILAGCASTRVEPRQATGDWERCANSRPAALTILCFQR